MQETVQPTPQDPNAERCPRCLQPVPPTASRCPGCRQPIHRLRLLPLAIGAAGLLLMIFIMAVMFRSVRNEDLTNAPVPVEETAQSPDGLLPERPANSNKQSAKPEKRPPLDER